MSKFNFKSAICTSIEQSERLLALGLKKETADMTIHIKYDGSWYVTAEPFYEWEDDMNTLLSLEDTEQILPAWSLHRLIEMIPKYVRAYSSGYDSPRLHPYVPKFNYLGVTIENIHEIIADFYRYTDLFDNIIDCIEWLIKEGYFNKEYLYENNRRKSI